MKKIIITLAAVAAAFTMASCNKEQLTESEGTPVVGNDVITAFTESTLTKTSLSGNDTDGYEVFWSEGDQIKIGGNTFTLTEGANTTTGKFQGTLPTEDGTYTACYPATYNGTDWPNEQTYTEGNITGSPMKASVAVSSGKVSGPLSFQNAGGILRLTVKGTAKIRSIKVNAAGLDEIVLGCGSGVTLDNTNGTVFHIAMPEGEYSGVSIAVWTIGFDNCTKKLKTGTKLIIEPSKITTASFTADFPDPTPTDPLPGEFTVNSYGKQVSFSKGNLRYTVASKEWSFFDKQYKCGPLNSVDKNEISLFTWGYNATQSIIPSGKEIINVSTDESGNLIPENDWGYTINTLGTWRTLTSDEWHYLFFGRPDAANKYGYATVGGQNGLIILPDEFTDPMKNGGSGAFKPQSSTASRWTDNYYTLAGNWEAMESAGAVFLPVTGRRSSDSIAMGDMGFYWSSSANDASDAYHIYFGGYNYDLSDNKCDRGLGCAVRLVKDIVSTTKGQAVATINNKATYVNWVQLWEDGPKFAEYNIGATSAEECGYYYAWGGEISNAPSGMLICDYVFSTVDLSRGQDTACKLWGSTWRMPTTAEFEALLSNCIYTFITQNSVNGLLCKGKEGTAYADNSVFFPAAGHIYVTTKEPKILNQGNLGKYWSTGASSNSHAYILYFGSAISFTSTKKATIETDYVPQTLDSVRAVLAE